LGLTHDVHGKDNIRKESVLQVNSAICNRKKKSICAVFAAKEGVLGTEDLGMAVTKEI